jgi:hypothetical protein
MNKDLLKRMIREYFDTIDTRFRSELQRQDEREQVIELADKAGLDPAFINELKLDNNFNEA